MVNAIADIHVKVDRNIKQESEAVLKQIGISLSDLINMTLRRVVYERRIPFDTQVSVRELPENMRISSRAQLMEYLKAGLDEDNGERFSLDEIRNHIAEKKSEYEKIHS